jgi:AcrR family transcriptional regulator
MSVVTETPRRGRPRDPAIDAKVLEATVELLEEEGFASATIQAISQRSGVPAPAIYRRWPTRLALIEHAALRGFAHIEVRATGDLGRDLRRFVRAYLDVYGTPAAQTAIPGLMASYQRGAVPAPARWIHISVRPQFYEILRAATPEHVDPSLDPDEIFDLLLGAILAHTFVPTAAGRARPVDRIVDLVVRLVRPTA